MSLNDILKEICTKDSIYDQIIDNILGRNSHLKRELISEISLSYLENKEKIEDIYAQGYFKYFFIRTLTNQVHSNTSPFYKNVISTGLDIINNDYDVIDDSEETIENKIDFENKLDLINQAYKDIKKNWFEATIWEDYYKNNKTHRQIEADWSIDHVLSWHTVNKMRKKIKDKINKN